MFFWAVAGGYFTFSCQLGISIPQSWIYLFFLPFSLSNVICKSNFSYHLNASASQMFPLYSSRFMSSLDYLFACLHTTGNLSSIWPELAPIKLALISLFLTPFFFLSHHEWYHCYPKHISCDSSHFGLLPESTLSLHLDLDMCFWIKLTSCGLLYLSINNIYSGFHHLISQLLQIPLFWQWQIQYCLIQNITETFILLNSCTGHIIHLFMSLHWCICSYPILFK